MDRTSCHAAVAREGQMKTTSITTAWLQRLALATGLLVGLAVALPGAVRAQEPASVAVEAVSSSIQGGVEVVRIDFSQPLKSAPSGFTIQSPARIALDVPGASNGLGRNTVEINQGNLRSVNVVQAGDRTRLVLNLKAATTYKTELQGNSLLVSLDPVAVAQAAPAAAP